MRLRRRVLKAVSFQVLYAGYLVTHQIFSGHRGVLQGRLGDLRCTNLEPGTLLLVVALRSRWRETVCSSCNLLAALVGLHFAGSESSLQLVGHDAAVDEFQEQVVLATIPLTCP